MFSKEESKRIRQEFWTAFGKSFPRKWILYNTKIKDLSFKFHFDRKSARVSIDIEDVDPEWRLYYFEKWESLKSLMQQEIEGLQFDLYHELENGKQIASIYTELKNVSIHNNTILGRNNALRILHANSLSFIKNKIYSGYVFLNPSFFKNNKPSKWTFKDNLYYTKNKNKGHLDLNGHMRNYNIVQIIT